MSYFNFDEEPVAQVESKTNGAPIKHKWIRTMNVGDVYKIPDGMKPNAIRCFCYQYGLERGQKFKVSIASKTVERMK